MVFDFGDSENMESLGPEDFAVFRDFICDKTGIRIRDNRVDYLEYRIQERMRVSSISDYREYFYKIKYSDEGPESEFQQLINLITVQETSFFRHKEQLDSLRDIVLKRIIERKNSVNDYRLRFWSAVCSTGEEPLTLAILLKEYFKELSHWSLSIMATDISTSALEKARKGEFSENSFRVPMKNFRKKYFVEKNSHFHATDEVKNMITYRHANLIHVDSLDIFRGVDVILCRNVFIYFPEEVKERIARKFYELLPKGGALILGNAEIIDVKKIPFRLEFHRGGPVYVKV
ncbi:MAG: protein-glutamate O-methyltransferase CheR [Deltaproteobacteria bacterium]|nr:protein-glutamate O-methyltransferase CheR [Deltaproteobacteria bacterium]